MIKKIDPIKFLGPLANTSSQWNSDQNQVEKISPEMAEMSKMYPIKSLGLTVSQQITSSHWNSDQNHQWKFLALWLANDHEVCLRILDTSPYTMYAFVRELCGTYAVQYKWQSPCYDNN